MENEQKQEKAISILCGGLAVIAIVLITQHSDKGLGYVGMLQKEIIENSKAIGKADTELVSETEYIIAQESTYSICL